MRRTSTQPPRRTDTKEHLQSLCTEPQRLVGVVLDLEPALGVCFVRAERGTLVGFTRKTIDPSLWQQLHIGTRVAFMYSPARSGWDLCVHPEG